jgi:hypothetical protein
MVGQRRSLQRDHEDRSPFSLVSVAREERTPTRFCYSRRSRRGTLAENGEDVLDLLGLLVSSRDSLIGDRHPKMGANFFESLGSANFCLLARRVHSLDAASPMLNQMEFMEDAAQHPVPQLRHSMLHVLERRGCKRQKARILDLSSVYRKQPIG